MSHKFKEGDRVRVKSNLKSEEFYGELYFNPSMNSTRGKVYTIFRVDNRGCYSLESCDYFYNDQMLEPVDSLKYDIGDKVQLKPDLILRKRYGSIEYDGNHDVHQHKILTIDGVDSSDRTYTIETSGAWFSEEMFIPANEDQKPSIDITPPKSPVQPVIYGTLNVKVVKPKLVFI